MTVWTFSEGNQGHLVCCLCGTTKRPMTSEHDCVQHPLAESLGAAKAEIVRLRGVAQALLSLCERSGIADDIVSSLFPDSKKRNGETLDEFAKDARRTLNEARAALSIGK